MPTPKKTNSIMSATLLLLIAVVCLTIGFFTGTVLSKTTVETAEINTFEDCVAANGGAIELIYPPRCTTADGTVFIDPTAEEVIIPTETTNPIE